jgi:hypothetical protein
MTVVATEAAESAAARARANKVRREATRDIRSKRQYRNQASGRRVSPEPAAPVAQPAAQTQARQAATDEAVSRSAPSGGISAPRIQAPGEDKYQTAILAEFLAAAAVVAFLPLATGGPENKNNPSPYTTNDIVQLAAIAMTYFILALLPGRMARWGAWLGLLVLVGVLYKKTASGDLSVALTSIHPSSTGPADQTL